ncbi:hypothetical protein [Oceanobacillus oncorhynchi]|uniref:hypothetical protein n=1 Tax=Oceanobacillus oncorhynchi TaxID=545501 RepID=UPI0034D74711
MEEQKETTAQTVVLKDIIKGLELHINKIGIYPNETVKQALFEDVNQLYTLKNGNALYQDGIANTKTGRKKYQR